MTLPTGPAGPTYGLGAIQSPPDENDWPIDALYASAGIDPVSAAPASYVVPAPYPPILDQGNTTRCVAFAQALIKGYEDLRDTGPADFDEQAFFVAIGGGPNGAIVRVALAELLSTGYPVVNLGQAAKHKIAAYYAVPVDEAAIKSAILSFGPVSIALPWYNTWFRPINGVLPAPVGDAGGHDISGIGWDSRGLRLRNSWGSSYGLLGDVYMPWSYLSRVWEVWKAIDQIIVPPPTITYRLIVAKGTKVIRTARLAGGCIAGWTSHAWSGKASSAPCHAPTVKRGCVSGQATIALASKGAFQNEWVRIGNGVSIVKIG